MSLKLRIFQEIKIDHSSERITIDLRSQVLLSLLKEIFLINSNLWNFTNIIIFWLCKKGRVTYEKKKKKDTRGNGGKTLLWGNFSFSIERCRNTFEIETRIGYCCRNRLSAEWSLTKVFPFGRPMRLIEDASSGCGKIKNANVSVPSTLHIFPRSWIAFQYQIFVHFPKENGLDESRRDWKNLRSLEQLLKIRLDSDSKQWKYNGLQEIFWFEGWTLFDRFI